METELNRMLAIDYLNGLAPLSTDELRSVRAECQLVETRLSYLRRLIQGRYDIASSELGRIKGGHDAKDLVSSLPEILADRIHAPGAGRLPTTMEPGELLGALPDRLSEITGRIASEGLGPQAPEVFEWALDALRDLEVEVSGYRRQMFDRIDAIQAELTGRYRDGSAQVDDLFSDLP